MKYIVSIRGSLPPDLTTKISQVHALAILKKPARALIASVGVLEVADEPVKPH